MIKPQFKHLVLCVLFLAFVIPNDVVLWDLGIIISDSSLKVDKPQPKVESTTKELKQGVVSTSSQHSVQNINVNINSINAIKTQSKFQDNTIPLTPTFKNAKQAVLKGKYVDAIKIFNVLNTDLSQALFWHVTALDRLGNHKEALQLIEKAKNVDDKLLFFKGQLLTSTQNHKDAVNCFKLLVKDYPQSDYLASAKIQISMLEKK